MSVGTSTADCLRVAEIPRRKDVLVILLLLLAVLFVAYRVAFRQMYHNWRLEDSYYSHGFLVIPISLLLVWLRRKELKDVPIKPSPLGYVLLLAGGLLLLAGDFLGFALFGQLSLIPVVAGLVLLLFGTAVFRIVWFPVAFLIFMVPIPTSVTQALALSLKLLATRGAVVMARTATVPAIMDGSFVHFEGDQLLIGEVCGGLRSLIALLALGAMMAYFSKTRWWARGLILALSAPIAIVSNIVRIFALIVVGYIWGSELASGFFHDASGLLIFAVAFALFFSVDTLLRRFGPKQQQESEV